MINDSSSSDPKQPVVPEGMTLIYRQAYRNKRTGKLMVAADYGKKAWCFLVPIKQAANDNAPSAQESSS